MNTFLVESPLIFSYFYRLLTLSTVLDIRTIGATIQIVKSYLNPRTLCLKNGEMFLIISIERNSFRSIHRIQNKHHWYAYPQSYQRFIFNKQDPNQMTLFHDTGEEDPDQIITCKDGIDFRFSNRGQ